MPLGHRIVAVAAQRMAAAQALGAEPASPEDPEPGDGFRSVIGAAGDKAAAARKPWREHGLIRPNEDEADLRRSGWYGVVRAGFAGREALGIRPRG